MTTSSAPTPLAPPNATPGRDAPLAMPAEEFRALGHRLVDDVADLLARLPSAPVTPGEPPRAVRALLGTGALPAAGEPSGPLLAETTRLLAEHSLFNGHPRFWGYITSSPAPIGVLAELLGAAVNPNVGAWVLSPLATEIETQAIRWIAELLGMPATSGGVLVSGGNMANFVGVLAARRAMLPWDVREGGLASAGAAIALYASRETHTWVQKAADLFGFGLDAIRWIDVDRGGRMRVDALDAAVQADREAGVLPLVAVGTAGTVSTGAIDPLDEIAVLCRERKLWFHVDGAYGAVAAALPDAPAALRALAHADSLAMDPHKWLYAPLEAGCALVRDPRHLQDAFSFHPAYYEFGGSDEDPPLNFHEVGPQNSRGFRALKVWLGLRAAGRDGVVRMIADDVALSRAMHAAVAAHPELEAVTQELSIATFRYVPGGLARGDDGVDADADAYLDALNRALLDRLQRSGEAFVSNAVVDGRYVLRACIVNFRTTRADVEALPEIVARHGRALDAEMRRG